MMARILISIMLVALVGCKTYEYKAQNKTELAKICTYEFPVNLKPIKTVIDTNVTRSLKLVLGSIDCTDRTGVQEIQVPTSIDTVYITKTNWIKDSAQMVYILSLEGELANKKERHAQELEALEEKSAREVAEHKAKASKSRRTNRITWGVFAAITGAYLFIRRIL